MEGSTEFRLEEKKDINNEREKAVCIRKEVRIQAQRYKIASKPKQRARLQDAWTTVLVTSHMRIEAEAR